MPDGLVASRAVLGQFLKPFGEVQPGKWFCSLAWQKANAYLADEPALTDAKYRDLANRFDGILNTGLVPWIRDRELTNPWMEQGQNTMDGIADFTNRLEQVKRDGVSNDAAKAIENVNSVLWEYYQCVLFEMTSHVNGTTVTDIRDQYWNREYATRTTETAPWTPGVTPDNVQDPGAILAERQPILEIPPVMPPLPPLPDTGSLSGTGGTSGLTGGDGTSGLTGGGETGGLTGGGGETGGGETGGGETGGGETGGGETGGGETGGGEGI